jgi:hypothetical protein
LADPQECIELGSSRFRRYWLGSLVPPGVTHPAQIFQISFSVHEYAIVTLPAATTNNVLDVALQGELPAPLTLVIRQFHELAFHGGIEGAKEQNPPTFLFDPVRWFSHIISVRISDTSLKLVSLLAVLSCCDTL